MTLTVYAFLQNRRKLAPGPFNTPSLKKEYGGVDPDLHLVPDGGPVRAAAAHCLHHLLLARETEP